MKKFVQIVKMAVFMAVGAAVIVGLLKLQQKMEEARILREIVGRLEADSRIAEVEVSGRVNDANSGRELTTIRFTEYDTAGRALEPKQFTFSANIIQFQSVVIRFDDKLVERGDKLRGKSAYVFLKAFALHEDGRAEVFKINEVNEVPTGYRVTAGSEFEKRLWRDFWAYALKEKEGEGVKNAQIEAPGTKFVPGVKYTIRIEHDGGMRIDAKR